jgi:hypothetical protein
MIAFDINHSLGCLLYGISDCLGNVDHIAGIDSSHRNSSVLQEVDMVLGSHDLTLLWGEASVREHTDLVSDNLPISWDF